MAGRARLRAVGVAVRRGAATGRALGALALVTDAADDALAGAAVMTGSDAVASPVIDPLAPAEADSNCIGAAASIVVSGVTSRRAPSKRRTQ